MVLGTVGAEGPVTVREVRPRHVWWRGRVRGWEERGQGFLGPSWVQRRRCVSDPVGRAHPGPGWPHRQPGGRVPVSLPWMFYPHVPLPAAIWLDFPKIVFKDCR